MLGRMALLWTSCYCAEFPCSSISHFLLHYLSTTFAALAARYWSGPPGGSVLTTANISLSRYLSFVFGSVYFDGKPVISQ